MPTEFTPFTSSIGGLLIGTSAAVLVVFNGRIAGISGILGGFLEYCEGKAGMIWRGLFLLGLVVGALGLLAFLPASLPGAAVDSWALLILAGLLVGVGTRLGSGCTSGHGICGISRLSTRSIAATLIFMAAAFVTTYVMRHVLEIGGAS